MMAAEKIEEEEFCKPSQGEAVIYSINQRQKLKDDESILKKQFPKLQVVIGELTPDDKPVRLDAGQMEKDRNALIDAATASTMGERIDRLEKPAMHPVGLYIYIIGFLSGVGACYLFYNVFPVIRATGM